MKYKLKRQRNLFNLLLLLISLLLIFFVGKSLLSSPEQQAKDVVDTFYSYEQKGDFSSSWALFHSQMKMKFKKGFYIQDRAHVFMNHFGVETFTYKLSKPDKLSNWKMSKETSPFKSVFKVTVTQTYKGMYGNFNLQQEVYVVKEKGEWRILWDYNK